MSPRKAVSATDMLTTARRGASRPAVQPMSAEPEGIDTEPLWEEKEQVDSATGRVVDKSSKEPVEQSSSRASITSAATAGATYVKVATSLTPELRHWIKTMPATLGTEGLSSSDLVRLALNRLRAEVKGGLPLMELLIEQAHTEAESMAGRKNRGLPTR